MEVVGSMMTSAVLSVTSVVRRVVHTPGPHALAVLLLLLAHGAELRTALAGESPLADAAERADWARVEAILKDGGTVNAAQADGMTALHWAAFHDHVESGRRLVRAGAKVNTQNRYAVTALSLACTNGSPEFVRVLLDAGADPNSALRGGETALMTAARTGRIEPVRALLDAKAQVDANDRKGQTALFWAAAAGHATVVDALVRAGADVHRRLKSGFTPLLMAAREGQIDVVRVLLKSGIDPNEAIVVERAGPRAPGPGVSALLLATENAHFELGVVLLQAGANPNDLRSGYTPLHTLSWVRKPNRGDDEDGQPPPIGSGSVTSMQFARDLVAAGADVNARPMRGRAAAGRIGTAGATPFLLASKTADLPYMRLLVELGADPRLANADGCTPLMAAAGLGTYAPTEEAGTESEVIDAVKYLLSLEADINAVDQNGETAMHGAAYKNLPKVVQLLAENGADIRVWNRKNKYGWTPLVIAEGFRHGNFKPSPETVAAIHGVMRAAGMTPPPPTPRPASSKVGYEEKKRG